MSEKNLLITGGTGFLGKALAKEFIAHGWEVTLLDLLPLDDSWLQDKVEVILGDVRDIQLLREKCKEQQVIIHAAAALPIQGSKKLIFDININGTKNVLTCAKKEGVEKVIYISSTAVYGVPKTHPIYEDDSLEPIGHYGVSKAEAEKICVEFRERGYPVVILRPKTFLGPGRLGIFQILFEWIYQGCLIYTIGNGSNRYQLLALSDLVKAVWLTANHSGLSETINLGAQEFRTVKEELETLIKYAQSNSIVFPLPKGPIKAILKFMELCRLSPLVEWHYRTASEDSFVSIEKAKQSLGWRSQKSNVDALIESYNEYCKNRNVYVEQRGITHTTSWNPKLLQLFRVPSEWIRWLRK